MRSASATAAFASALLTAAPAWACAVCGQVNASNQGAYLDMTLVISALPLAMLGGLTWWLVKRVRAAALLDAQAFPARPTASAATPATESRSA